MQPLRRFPLDAAIIFSDILTIPDALGLELEFVAGEGPQFRNPLNSPRAIANCREIDTGADFDYLLESLERVRAELSKETALLGFSGSPWTLACYMLSGGSSKDFREVRGWLFRDPEGFDTLVSHLAALVADYLCAQLRAGAQAVMIFDSWGGLLDPTSFARFSLRPIEKVIQHIRRDPELHDRPVIVFSKGTHASLEQLAASGADALGLDWGFDIGQIRRRLGPGIGLQGNLDPAVMLADEATVRREAKRVLDSHGSLPGHVFNLGHGITPDVEPDRVGALVDAVHSYART